MAQVFLVDLSGKVEKYDQHLYSSLVKVGVNAILYCPKNGLISLIPRKWKYSENKCKRGMKVIEGLINYFFLSVLVCIKKPEILHLQWLPFMEICGIEIPIIKIIKSLSRNTKIVLTIHNIYPHNMSSRMKQAYNERFKRICPLIDCYIVHNEISKQDVIREFGLDPSQVNVCCHGVFAPDGISVGNTSRVGGKLHLLQFGGQSFYKGTDVLVDAVCGMNKLMRSKIETRIVGKIEKSYLDNLKSRDKDGDIIWNPKFLDDSELYKEINRCDIVALPYRAISQSGVLLLSIFFEKLIICSDLPSFVETMRGGEDDGLDSVLFFRKDNSESLRLLLEKYINKEVDEDAVHNRVKHIKQLYSWESAAEATRRVYNKLG